MVEIEKTLDGWYGKVQKEVGTKIANFTAFFFFIMAIGAFIGILVMQHYPGQAMLAVIMPAIAGALAYYNRAFATAVFVILILLIFVF